MKQEAIKKTEENIRQFRDDCKRIAEFLEYPDNVPVGTEISLFVALSGNWVGLLAPKDQTEGVCLVCNADGGWIMYPPSNAGPSARPFWEPCPRGCPDRRKEERRKVDVYTYTSKYPDGKSEAPMFVISEDHHALDRRTLKDRRK